MPRLQSANHTAGNQRAAEAALGIVAHEKPQQEPRGDNQHGCENAEVDPQDLALTLSPPLRSQGSEVLIVDGATLKDHLVERLTLLPGQPFDLRSELVTPGHCSICT